MRTSRNWFTIASLATLGLLSGCEEDENSESSVVDAGEETQGTGDDSDDATSGSTDATGTETDTEADEDTEDGTDPTDSAAGPDAGSEEDPDDSSPEAGAGDPETDSGTGEPGSDGPSTDGDTSPTDPEATDATDEPTEADETDPTDLPEIVTSKVAYFALTQIHSEVSAGETTVSVTGAGISAGFMQYEIRVDPETDPQDPQDACEIVTVGACTLTVCATSEEPAPEEPAPESPVLSTTELLPTSVRVTGLLVDPIDVPHASLAEGLGAPPEASDPVSGVFGYNIFTIPGTYWAGGETARILVEASDEVPAFDISFQPPSPVAWTSPTNVNTSAALELTWTGGGVGDAYIVVGGSTADDVSHSILCTVPTSAGQVSVDASLLDGLEGAGTVVLQTMATAAGTQGEFSYSVIGQYQGPARLVTFVP